MMHNASDPNRRGQRLPQLCRTVWFTAIPAGILYGAVMLALHSHGTLVPGKFTRNQILFQSFWIGIATPAGICSMFWVATCRDYRKWAERVGFLILFVAIPSVAILGLIRWLTDR